MSSEPRIYGLREQPGRPEGALKYLHVEVIEAKDLCKKDIFGLSDPYCKVMVYRGDPTTGIIDSATTQTKKKTLDPKWNETFTFRVNPLDNNLLVQVFDENRVTRDDFLGEVYISIKRLRFYQIETVMEISLKPRSIKSRVKGKVCLKLSFTNDPSPPPAEQTDLPGFPIGRGPLDFPASTSPNVNTNATPNATAPLDTPSSSAQNTTPNATPNATAPLDIPTSTSRNFTPNATPTEQAIGSAPSIGSGMPDIETPSLPAGWEQRQDALGRRFYIDHNTRTTCWEIPNSPVRRRIEMQQDEINRERQFRIRRHLSVEDDVQPNPEPAPIIVDSAETPTVTEETNTNDQAALSEPLPPGWAMQQAPNGRVFFIDHNTQTTSWHDPRLNRTAASAPSLSSSPPSAAPNVNQDLGPLPDGWEERLHADGRVFYIDHATRSTQWEDPRLQIQKSKTQVVPYSRDYKRKCDYFRSKLKRPSNVPNKYEIHIRRNNLLEDSFRAVLLSVRNSDVLKAKLWVVFDGETGLDYGGVQREWFYLLSREVFNPYYGLFEYSASDNYTLQINPNSGLCNEDHLNYFKFIGRVAGMAVYHGKLLDAFFIRPFYKMMLNKPITLIDMESVDSEYFNSLNWILENDPECLDLHFCVDEDLFGELKVKELKPGGADIKLTNENKLEYINLVIKWRFVSRVEDQMRKFMEGFNELIPHNLHQIFDEREVELLMCGLGDIDTTDWRKNANYRGEYHDKHIVIQWFWKAVNSFDMETRARLLQFVTGTSRVPMNGFSELYGSNGPQKFTVEPWGSPHCLPRAHTCFNRLDLPRYRSYYELREKLRIAIENTQGFEGVD
ncbi:E3 ubiquitin-protein ligase NEDD4-like [Exaiptasia diaphana]|uniref:E3 ubiquitin-protein ligase n=1 Tax=Exaiptasia diaphana TaxID=2652724 RepID=A0A913Y6Y3_EXADI|nr:E3 ubiquitin-protein ligase NEDD4-like [Exaiptasia diaphana]KXJ28856.1 E3 ubiquitin-protein ligase NEDD4-like [Exaiptasia diaphana]